MSIDKLPTRNSCGSRTRRLLAKPELVRWKTATFVGMTCSQAPLTTNVSAGKCKADEGPPGPRAPIEAVLDFTAVARELQATTDVCVAELRKELKTFMYFHICYSLLNFYIPLHDM